MISQFLIKWSVVSLPRHPDALITSSEHLEILQCGLRGKRFELELIMKGSRDGKSASVFHSLCDNQGPTVMVIKSGEQYFGGFTQKSWKSPRVSEYECDQEAFLFSFTKYSVHASRGQNTQCLQHRADMLGSFCGPRGEDLYMGEYHQQLFLGDAFKRTNLFQQPSRVSSRYLAAPNTSYFKPDFIVDDLEVYKLKFIL
ncbi:hypothetical protein FGO68_gene4498 [Halteria grandinella]|uniref:TLDc domain-containing protein n=1 Tax=Halteria grandinella TaxID=5974 RepID=A0A8J8NYR5_HALGN|nr:hypothetical protein FGO68_gene4498 [Halteria grandinella]